MASDALTEELEGLAALVVYLLRDANICVTRGKLDTRTAPDQFWARTLIRSVIVSIEAISFRARRAALLAHEQREADLSEAELALLKPEAFLTDQGKVKTRERRLKTRPGILFSLDILMKALGEPRGANREGQGFEALQKTLTIRDRITHPKSIESLAVSPEELRTMTFALSWLGSEFKRLAEGLANRSAVRFTSRQSRHSERK